MIESSVSLVGDGSSTTAIVGDGTKHAVWVKAGWVNITGFSVIGGAGSMDVGIHVEGEKVELSINGGEWLVAEGVDSWDFEWDSSKVDNGEYEIKVRAFDGEDHSDELTIKVKVANSENGNGGGFLPGFELVFVLVSLAWCAVGVGRKKDRS